MTEPGYYETYWSGSWAPTNEVGSLLGRVLGEALSHATSCVDVGCGDGRTSLRWRRDSLALVGVDVSATAVSKAREAGLDALVISDATELPYEDGSFDVALCLEVLEHLLAPADVAAEVHRVVRPGGALIATVPNVAYWRRRADLAVLGRWNPLGDPRSVSEPWRDPHIRFFTTRSLGAMLRHAGYEDVIVGGHGGGILRDVPVSSKLRQRDASPVYRRLERVAPALLGARLHAVAVKPGPRLPSSNAAIAALRRRITA